MISRFFLLFAMALFFAMGSANACITIDRMVSVYSSVSINDISSDDFSETEFVGDIYLKEPSLWWMRTDNKGPFRARVVESVSHPELNGSLIFVVDMNGSSCGPFMDYKDRGVITGTFTKSGSAFTVWPKVQKNWPF